MVIIKFVLSLVAGWFINNLLTCALAFVEATAKIPLMSAYLASGLVYPVSILIYALMVYLVVVRT